MDAIALVKGIGIGVAVAAPVGPMSVLCMRRTLVTGWGAGFATGLGIATGDAAYASVAALGLAGVSRFMLAWNRPLHAAAGSILLYLGLRMFFARSGAEAAPERPSRSRVAAYASAVLLTLTNPPTIVSFAAIFTVLAPVSDFATYASLAVVAGVLVGSTLWWLGLTATVSLARHALGPRARRRIDVLSGAILACFGAVEIRRAL